MPGVKTSKGCSTCRRRKKGCDKAVPFCGQCTDAGIVCGGYSREYLFVNSTSANSNAYYGIESTSPQAGSSRRGSQSNSASSSSIVLHDSLARTARDIRYVERYWTAFLPFGRPFSVTAMRLSNVGWTQFYHDLCRSDPTLRYATLALSLCITGAQENDAQLSLKGFEAYGVAVREMNLSLRDASNAHADGLLASTRLLRLYEVLFGLNSMAPHQPHLSSQIDGYRGHTDGETALILARGPEHLQTGAGHWLFTDTRLNSVIAAVSMRKRTPFSQTTWKTVPWALTEKTPMDRLVDALADISGLLEDLDRLRAMQGQGESPGSGYQTLLADCHGIQNSLSQWEREFRGRLGTYDYVVVGLPLPEPTQDVHFATIHLACMYWAICVLLFTTVQACERALALTETHHTDAIAALARRISHAIPLLFDHPAGLWGALASFFSIGVAIQYLTVLESEDVISNEKTILLGVMYREFAGSFVGRFLINLQHRAVSSQAGGTGSLTALERARLWFTGSKDGSLS